MSCPTVTAERDQSKTLSDASPAGEDGRRVELRPGHLAAVVVVSGRGSESASPQEADPAPGGCGPAGSAWALNGKGHGAQFTPPTPRKAGFCRTSCLAISENPAPGLSLGVPAQAGACPAGAPLPGSPFHAQAAPDPSGLMEADDFRVGTACFLLSLFF